MEAVGIIVGPDRALDRLDPCVDHLHYFGILEAVRVVQLTGSNGGGRDGQRSAAGAQAGFYLLCPKPHECIHNLCTLP